MLLMIACIPLGSGHDDSVIKISPEKHGGHDLKLFQCQYNMPAGIFLSMTAIKHGQSWHRARNSIKSLIAQCQSSGISATHVNDHIVNQGYPGARHSGRKVPYRSKQSPVIYSIRNRETQEYGLSKPALSLSEVWGGLFRSP